MATAAPSGSLRSEYNRRRGRSRLPARPGEERGLTADLAPPAGKALAPVKARPVRLPRPAPARRVPGGARTLLTMSVVFSWFGL
jgi:hypothetical protein